MGGGPGVHPHGRGPHGHRRPGRPPDPGPRLRLVPGRPGDRRPPDRGRVARAATRPGGRDDGGRALLPAGPGRPRLRPGADRLGRRPGQRPPPGMGSRRRPPRVRPQARHARRRGRRHPAAPPAGRTAPAGTRSAPGSSSSSGPARAGRCGTTAPPTPASSSPSPPRPSSTSPCNWRRPSPSCTGCSATSTARTRPPGSAGGRTGRSRRVIFRVMDETPDYLGLPTDYLGAVVENTLALPQGRQPGRARRARPDLPGLDGRGTRAAPGTGLPLDQRHRRAEVAGVHPPPGTRRPGGGRESARLAQGQRRGGPERPRPRRPRRPGLELGRRTARPRPGSGTGGRPTRSSSTGPTPRRRPGSRPRWSRPNWRRTGSTSSCTSSTSGPRPTHHVQLAGSFHFHATDVTGEWVVEFGLAGVTVRRDHEKAVRGRAGARRRARAVPLQPGRHRGSQGLRRRGQAGQVEPSSSASDRPVGSTGNGFLRRGPAGVARRHGRQRCSSATSWRWCAAGPRPPSTEDGHALPQAPLGRTLGFMALGLVVAFWASGLAARHLSRRRAGGPPDAPDGPPHAGRRRGETELKGGATADQLGRMFRSPAGRLLCQPAKRASRGNAAARLESVAGPGFSGRPPPARCWRST